MSRTPKTPKTLTIHALAARVRSRHELPAPPARRALRKAAGVSLEEVAAVLGVTRQAVALWEFGERRPRGENLDGYIAVLRMFEESVANLSTASPATPPEPWSLDA